jgi:hypothetical protein
MAIHSAILLRLRAMAEALFKSSNRSGVDLLVKGGKGLLVEGCGSGKVVRNHGKNLSVGLLLGRQEFQGDCFIEVLIARVSGFVVPDISV